MADFVNVAATPAAHLIDSQDIPTLWTGELGGSARLLAGTSGPNMLELWRWELFPGESFASAGHPNGTTELFHVEKGTLHLTVGDAELIVGPGVFGGSADGCGAWLCQPWPVDTGFHDVGD